MVTTAAQVDVAKVTAKFFEGYARKYSAGAFATPLPVDMATALDEDRVHTWGKPGSMVAGYEVVAKRDLTRNDFTGQSYKLPKGSHILNHLALDDSVKSLPNLKEFDFVYGYVEDERVRSGLAKQGFRVQAVRISASSEVVGCFARKPEREYPAFDASTLSRVKFSISDKQQAQILKEIRKIEGWRDDYPYYNRDGSWTQVSLRGYKPEDPFWGVKPSEMSKNWKEQHPDEAALTECDWTVLTARTPALMELLTSVPWWSKFERIRLLKLSGREGKGGKLLRHTDITDRDAGTRDGQICRFHFPLVSHPDVRTIGWNLQGEQISTNLKPWNLYYLDQRKPHMVINPSSVERVHLVPDVIADSKVRDQLSRSKECVSA